ncbi:uncharacterized protein LOC124146107 [Haliotis rufescens]|uniref:uncharacterized protein LOC124146107 n=1 Tax=Haliotis rufescens TaxID=6454 RepID=UPI00201EF532|nr:uncharacterized protein LOC124146107 [Haliotis rufescens]
MDIQTVMMFALFILPGPQIDCIALGGIDVLVHKMNQEMERVLFAARANCPACEKGCVGPCFRDILEELDGDIKLLRGKSSSIDVASDCSRGMYRTDSDRSGDEYEGIRDGGDDGGTRSGSDTYGW